jgi:hypothetical protein
VNSRIGIRKVPGAPESTEREILQAKTIVVLVLVPVTAIEELSVPASAD